MSHFETRSFICDGKFSEVIDTLLGRNWRQVFDKNLSYELVWDNYVKLKFKDHQISYVNHFQGSKHLSNKGYISYHLKTSNRLDILPPTWSSAFEVLKDLLVMVITNSIYCLIYQIYNELELINGTSPERISSFYFKLKEKYISKYFRFQKIFHYLISLDENIPVNASNLEMINMLKPMETFLNSVKSQMEKYPVICYHEHKENIRKILSDFLQLQPWRRWGGVENIWIIKPVGKSCGEGIELAKNLEDILTIIKRMNYKCILQKYIEKPLLVRKNRKFDIRQWVLITNLNPIVIYGFSECYLRLSSLPYSTTSDNIQNKFVHLCNNSIQKVAAAAVGSNSSSINTIINTNVESLKNDNITNNRNSISEQSLNIVTSGTVTKEEVDVTSTTPENVGKHVAYALSTTPSIYHDTMMTQSEFEIELRTKYTSSSEKNYSAFPPTDTPFHDLILPKIKKITIDTILAVKDRLVKVGKGFEWLGLDLMVSETLEDVILLEVNMSPDITHSTPVTSRLVTPAIEDLFRLILDEGAADDISTSYCEGDEASIPYVAPRSEGSEVYVNEDIENIKLGDAGRLVWDHWYTSDSLMTNPFSLIEQRKAKEQISILGQDYLPRGLELLETVQKIMNEKVVSEIFMEDEDEKINDSDASSEGEL